MYNVKGEMSFLLQYKHFCISVYERPEDGLQLDSNRVAMN